MMFWLVRWCSQPVGRYPKESQTTARLQEVQSISKLMQLFSGVEKWPNNYMMPLDAIVTTSQPSDILRGPDGPCLAFLRRHGRSRTAQRKQIRVPRRASWRSVKNMASFYMVLFTLRLRLLFLLLFSTSFSVQCEIMQNLCLWEWCTLKNDVSALELRRRIAGKQTTLI